MMKKQHLLILFFCLIAGISKANPGDTTWVQAHNVQFDHYGNFDSTVQFPTGSVSYRKIYMIFTLGEYACPAGSQYCHQWDYTIQNYLMTPGGDTIELSRFISPYANSGVPRFPSTWQQHYVFDVTDFYPLLKNNATVRVSYSGYSWGFTGNVKFAFIEGTPDRNVTGIQKIYDGYYGYGNAADPIGNHLPVASKTAPAGTQSAALRFIVSGHGSDANGCCEFASHYYDVKLNGNNVAHKDIWRSDCGLNQIYPQGGTWIYERANWCPGSIVVPIYHDLTGVSAGSNYTLGLDFEPYTVSSPSGGYNTQAAVFYHGGFNKTLDASVEDIIAPTVFEDHFRENPSSSSPIIRIHNSGSTTITSVSFKYGVKDSVASQYTWTGSLAALKDTIITLPAVPAITNMSYAGASGMYQFAVQIQNVNGQADNDHTNDTLRSSFVVAPNWPTTFVVAMKTNNEGVSGLNQGPSETSWQITDMNNNVVASRTNANVSTIYNDTITLSIPGFYKLTINDGGCDGLHWWVWDANPSAGVTAGYLNIKRANGIGLQIPMNGYTYSGTYANDFGCGFTQYFTSKGWAAGINNVTNINTDAAVTAYPNPARDNVTISITGVQAVEGTLEVVDALGRVVLEQQINTAEQTINTSSMANGVYTIVFRDAHAANTKLQTRLVIAR